MRQLVLNIFSLLRFVGSLLLPGALPAAVFSPFRSRRPFFRASPSHSWPVVGARPLLLGWS